MFSIFLLVICAGSIYLLYRAAISVAAAHSRKKDITSLVSVEYNDIDALLSRCTKSPYVRKLARYLSFHKEHDLYFFTHNTPCLIDSYVFIFSYASAILRKAPRLNPAIVNDTLDDLWNCCYAVLLGWHRLPSKDVDKFMDDRMPFYDNVFNLSNEVGYYHEHMRDEFTRILLFDFYNDCFRSVRQGIPAMINGTTVTAFPYEHAIKSFVHDVQDKVINDTLHFLPMLRHR